MITYNKIIFCLGLTALSSLSYGEDIKISKLDLDMYKLYILVGIRQNCQPDPITHQQAPLCLTMRAMVDEINKLTKKGTITFKDIVLPLAHALKKDIENSEKMIMDGDKSNVIVTANTPEEMELLSMIDALIIRLESKQPCSDQELEEEFAKIKAKYDERLKKINSNQKI
ncbi:MAG TPA: hypothetical protein VJ201_07195 [Candidatus Babeliales bacterium]|nr:hypothetical protein [Candidatus Babeliales bacterium]